MTYEELFEQVKKKRSFLCVGLDSDIKKIPEHLMGAGDPVFEFNKAKHSLYLPLPIFNGGEEGKTFLAAAQNNMDKDNPSANIYILKWTGSNFGKYKVLPLQGTLYDMKQGNFGPFKNTLAAVYGTAEGGFMAVYATDNF